MGPQGSGKGTIGEMLANKMKLPLISVGELLRNLPQDHPFYPDVREAMHAGELAPEEKVASILSARLEESDCSQGYVLDGWCRRMLDIEVYNPQPDAVLVLEISRDTSVKRITGRRICTSNGKTYNIYTLPKEQLAECEGELVQREDDTKEAVEKRLDIYYSETQEVLDFFEEKGILLKIDAEVPPEEVFENALSALKYHE